MYPYSVIPGGVESAQELKYAVFHDPVVAGHYANFDLAKARIVHLDRDRAVYVSYRIGDRVFWTKKTLKLFKGEALISDGVHEARTRCGNRVSDTPDGPVSPQEPSPTAMATPQPPALYAVNQPPPGFPVASPLPPGPGTSPSGPPGGGVIPPPIYPIGGGGPTPPRHTSTPTPPAPPGPPTPPGPPAPPTRRVHQRRQARPRRQVRPHPQHRQAHHRDQLRLQSRCQSRVHRRCSRPDW